MSVINYIEPESLKISVGTDDDPDIVWDIHRDVRMDGVGSNAAAKIAVALAVDDNMWDIVHADLTGIDPIQAIDRTIAALNIAREGLLRTGAVAGAVPVQCLVHHGDGRRCNKRGAHQEHTFSEGR